jgi:UDP-N-acetylmuramyl pentapeptide phosphotransferase/UDP-N-acetylglucosamine-1-phosphate transferase
MVAALSWIAFDDPDRRAAWIGLAGGIGTFAALGLFDDLRSPPTWIKFVVQLAAASVLVGAVFALPPSIGWLGMAATIVACAFAVNVWNFMDGSNGLIAVQGFVVSSALALWPGQDSHLRLAALALAAACTGFLPFNVPNARVFLGDVGSHALGAAVFGLGLWSLYYGGLTLAQVLLMVSALWLDAVLTLVRRALAGRRVWRAHREHLYQYAVRVGHSHARVCLFYGAWTAGAIVLALWAEGAPASVGWSLLSIAALIGAAIYFSLRHRWLRRRPRAAQP